MKAVLWTAGCWVASLASTQKDAPGHHPRSLQAVTMTNVFRLSWCLLVGVGGGSSTQTGLVEKHCKRIGWFVIRSPAHRQHAPRGQGLVCILNTHAWHIIRDQYATVKSLQSRPTLCDPIDGSPPGSSVPGFSRQEYWSGLPFPSPKWGQQNLITHDKTAHWPTLWYKINATSTFHGVSWWPAIQTLRF